MYDLHLPLSHLGIMEHSSASLPQQIAGVEAVRYLHLTHESLGYGGGDFAWTNQWLPGKTNGGYDTGHQQTRLLQAEVGGV